MKKSKRYIKKQNNKPLINKKVLAKVIRESNICKHAIKELNKFEIEKPVGDLANKINFDLLNTFFNHQHEMTRSSSINKTTMKNILNDGRDISIAKLVENTSLIIK